MKPIQMPIDSDALRANIVRTAQPVVVPERYLPLAQAVEGLYGVRTPLTETLAEYFHPFRNADLLIDGFQTILLRNWTYFERSDDRARCFELLSKLVLDLLDSQLSGEQTSLLLRQLLTWCTAALNGPHPGAYDKSLRTVAKSLSRLLPRQPLPFLERDTLLRGLAESAARRPSVERAFSELYRALLLLGYRRVTERLPIPEWAGSVEAELTDPEGAAAHFAPLAPERVAEFIVRVKECDGDRVAVSRSAHLLLHPRPSDRPGLPHRRP